MRHQIVQAICKASPEDLVVLQELLDVADELKRRVEGTTRNDNTELMQRARRLLDS